MASGREGDGAGIVSSDAYELHPEVALRLEPFGGLAYHYGNRRLTFLRSPELVSLVRSLDSYGSLDGALAASGIDRGRWSSYRKALVTLEASGIVRRRAPSGQGAGDP